MVSAFIYVEFLCDVEDFVYESMFLDNIFEGEKLVELRLSYSTHSDTRFLIQQQNLQKKTFGCLDLFFKYNHFNFSNLLQLRVREIEAKAQNILSVFGTY